jgi:GTP-binding nuclear protein Ran
MAELKMVFIGDCCTGKSTYIKRLSTGVFEKDYYPNYETIVKCLSFSTNKGVKNITVWDCSGKDDVWFRDIHLLGADTVVIMFDVTTQSTYDNLEKWYKIGIKSAPKANYIICGNKVDISGQRKVLPKNIHFHRIYNLQYYDISAKSNYNIEKPLLNALIYKFGKDIILM